MYGETSSSAVRADDWRLGLRSAAISHPVFHAVQIGKQ